ncbi:MAG: sugar phosphate isomerase/epimerase [Planctomycetaceae bacterium]|nr:MAG: sugar phosphate isomerase/epimerase [Planctomycetaceae bacterium]
MNNRPTPNDGRADCDPKTALTHDSGAPTRRQFIRRTATVASLLSIAGPLGRLSAAEETKGPRLRKTLKIGMIRVPGTLTDKFAAARQAGFDGVELDAPGFDIAEAKAAMKITGLIIDGTVNANHWNVRHSDPDPEVRAAALKSCIDGLRATAAVGGDTMLLVPGHGKDGSEAEVFERTLANIKQALPVAEEVGVKIAIENVWNHFLYDHEGGSDQTADELARFVDAFDSPWVGVQFDIGNHWKYGDPAEWIRTLGKRVIKLDIKGFSRAEDKFTPIGEGDIDWASVRQALIDIDFRGWIAAEVQGGDVEKLKEVSRQIDETVGLT